jgi:hypothetical protein
LTADEAQRSLLQILDPVFYLQSIGWRLRGWQEWVHKQTWRYWLIVAGRQTGKTWLAASKARHAQVKRQRYPVPVVCPNKDKGQKLVDELTIVAGKDKDHKIWDPDNQFEKGEYGVKVSVMAGTVTGVVGETAPLLIVDEAGRVEKSLFEAATPVMSSFTEPTLWVMSSAWYKDGWFWEAWDKGPCYDREGIGYIKVMVRPPLEIRDGRVIDFPEQERFVAEQADRGVHAFWSGETPTAETIEQELARHGEKQVRQQYFCEFQEIQDAAFAPELVARAWSGEPGRRLSIGEMGSYISGNEGRRL